MRALQVERSAAAEALPEPASVQASIRQWGERIFALMDAAGPPSLFSKSGLYGTLMDWSMRDEQFKTQLFRFVDVLPALVSAAEITRHLKEYLDSDAAGLPPVLRTALKASGGISWLFGAGMKAQVAGLARQFMLGNDGKEIAGILRKLHAQGVAFTADVLGEKVVSEPEADAYARRYMDLLDLLGRETGGWPPTRSNLTDQGEAPRVNVSIKLSALYSQIHPADPGTAVSKISGRLRPILRRARDLGAFINFDMEHYALKELILRVFKMVFTEPEFLREPACGLALQAYLRDCQADLLGIIAWAREQRRRVTVRLVKGAYWDYETVIAEQKGWPVPVFTSKAETDANFEKLSIVLLENIDTVDAAFGTHNVRSIAHVLAQGARLGLPWHQVEFQMLHGMAEPVKAALLRLDCRVREYCPVGELLPGMAYLVRRLLENTSNESFLANAFAKGADREALLRPPLETVAIGEGQLVSAAPGKGEPGYAGGSREFKNEPPTDFTIAAERERMRVAISALRRSLGQRQPLVINNRPVNTREWKASLNPANQIEVIGHAARAGIAEAEAALAAARAAQPQWARRPADDRAGLLRRAAGLMRRDRGTLCALEILEAGKNWTEADADVAEAIDFCEFYAAVMCDLGRSQRTERVAGESNIQHWQPRGAGVVIAPWNFPLAILTGMTTAAVVAGNTVVLKPSDETPILAGQLMDLLVEAGLPAGVVNLLTGPGRTVGAHLAAHPQVDFIAFTGSKEAGLKIWEEAGRTLPGQANLKKVVCELGGKNCVIVDGDADLDEAVSGVLTAAFGYQGQKCSALSRLVVLADNYDKFLERLIAGAASMCAGRAEEPGTMIGPVINREARERILAVIDAGKREARLAWQGEVPNDPHACYVGPAIFTDTPPRSRLFREEIFGPVLTVTKAKDFDQALALANDSEFALTGGLYSRSPAHIERAKTEFACGNLYINRPITGALVGRQPFGGFRMSGGGTKAGGREYLLNFLLPRVVTENCLRRGFAPAEAE